MIHCDEVFDILTRGPFPTGSAADGIVESHLNQCDACRQLAEALRPAVELFQEAITPEESAGLPRYGGALITPPPWSARAGSPVSTRQMVARPASRFAATLRHTTAPVPWRAVGKFAAAACIGLVLAGMLRQMALSRRAPQGPASASISMAASWKLGIDGRQWAIDQGLAGRCRQWIRGFSVAAAPEGVASENTLQLACCLSCHGGQFNRLLPTSGATAFAQACQACH